VRLSTSANIFVDVFSFFMCVKTHVSKLTETLPVQHPPYSVRTRTDADFICHKVANADADADADL
jgi:hypothetical protein